jgi:hypothetical protein
VRKAGEGSSGGKWLMGREIGAKEKRTRKRKTVVSLMFSLFEGVANKGVE